MVPTTVQIIWAALLVVLVLGLPVIVFSLHRAWKSALAIDRYFAEMLEAAGGIARNADSVAELDATLDEAGQLLDTAGGIHDNAAAIHSTLAERAAKAGD